MTITEILAAKIPEGKYAFTLGLLKRSYYPSVCGQSKPRQLTEEESNKLIDANNSFCASFEALYRLEKDREYVIFCDDCKEETVGLYTLQCPVCGSKNVKVIDAYTVGLDEGYAKALDELSRGNYVHVDEASELYQAYYDNGIIDGRTKALGDAIKVVKKTKDEYCSMPTDERPEYDSTYDAWLFDKCSGSIEALRDKEGE